MADRSSNRVVTFTEPISGLPAIDASTGAPQLFGQFTQAFTDLASTSAERLSRFRVEQAALEGIVAAESDNPKLIEDARTLADVTRNRNFRTSFSQRMNRQLQESLLKAEEEFPANSIEFRDQIGLELQGMAEEIEKATPALAPGWIARAQAKIEITALGVKRRENAAVDEANIVGINETARTDTQYSASVGALSFDTGPIGNSIRDIMASQFVEFEDMLHQQNAANNGPLLSPKQIDMALVQYAQSIANEAIFGLMEASFQVPGGPIKLRDDVNAGKLTVLAHDRTDGKFAVIEVPIKTLLGNKQIAQVNSHLTALASRQEQGVQSANEVERHKARGISNDAILLAGRGRMIEFPLSELGALPPGEVLNAQHKFDNAIIKHEMSSTVLQGEPAEVFGLLADEEETERETIYAQIGSPDPAQQAAGFRRLDQWTELFRERSQAIAANSYLWVLGASPEAAIAVQAMMPAEAHEFLDGEFDRLGVPLADRRYIPPDLADELTRDVAAMETTFDQAIALKKFSVAQGLQGPRILNTMFKKDGFPEKFYIAAQLDSPRAAAIYLDAVELDQAKLKDRLSTDQIDTIKEELNSLSGAFNALFLNTIPPGNDLNADPWRSAMQHLALTLTVRGQGAVAAVESAFRLLTGKTRFQGTVRVPEPFHDDDSIAAGLPLWRSILRGDGTTPTGKFAHIIAPRSLDDIAVLETFGREGLSIEQEELTPERRESFMIRLMSGGVPYTEPLGRGVNIWLENQVIKDKRGLPILIEWDEYRKIGLPTRQQILAAQSGRLIGPTRGFF